MTTATKPLTVTSLDSDGFDEDGDLLDMNLEMAAVGLTYHQFDGLYDEDTGTYPPSVDAFEKEVIGAAVAEVLPQLKAQAKAMVIEAVERRLPWTWEPER